MSGAFSGLDKIARRRLRESTIGFAAKNEDLADQECLERASTKDFIDFGFEPEFIGRLPVRVMCQPLDADDLFNTIHCEPPSYSDVEYDKN